MDDPNWDQRKRLKDMLQGSWLINEKVDIGVNKQLNVKLRKGHTPYLNHHIF